jgi:hypothetical protein
MSFDPGTALSYPYIHVRDLNEVKASLLYWDKVRRIVPDPVRNGDYAIGDSKEAEQLADKGLLVSTNPYPYETAASGKFFEHISPHQGRFQIDFETAEKYVQQENRGLHIEKMGKAVLLQLNQMGLAHQVGDWVGMHDEVGSLYMYCLAAEIGQQMNLPLMASIPDDEELGQALLFEPSTHNTETTTEQLVQLGLGLPSAADLDDIPLDKVIAFHHERYGERIAFRTEVEKILETARASQDANAVTDYLHSQRLVARKSLATIDRRFGSSQWEP